MPKFKALKNLKARSVILSELGSSSLGIAYSTRLQLETYLNVQEKSAKLSEIERELVKLEIGLQEWGKVKEEKSNSEYKWEPINEIAVQARNRLNYLKEQEHKIMELFSTYKQAIKNSDGTLGESLKTQIETLIRNSKEQAELING